MALISPYQTVRTEMHATLLSYLAAPRRRRPQLRVLWIHPFRWLFCVTLALACCCCCCCCVCGVFNLVLLAAFESCIVLLVVGVLNNISGPRVFWLGFDGWWRRRRRREVGRHAGYGCVVVLKLLLESRSMEVLNFIHILLAFWSAGLKWISIYLSINWCSKKTISLSYFLFSENA